ncbi:IgGFc-binding protein-like [Polyodon spathula]|uniref:IgGFc-binding protein-like n=1 Tax=Polyodon spathula TaxID=7913 RepID=UPI001B7DBE3F|nr:IgGFc-binding protein-like [Polyodon spathula]
MKNSNCNTLVQQLLPVPQWGTTFIVPPLPYQNDFDLVYVTASQQTNFQIQSGSELKSLALDRGQSISLPISLHKPLYIHASAGIQVLYYCTGGRVGGQMFDPFLMNILPTDTFCQKYSVQGHEGFTSQAMVVSKTADISGIMFDKKVQSLVWTPIPGTEFSWALSDFGSQPIQHVVEHPTAAIGVYSIGKADQNAYGSSAPCYNHSDCLEITDGIQYATLITQNYLPGNDPQFNLSISARSAAATQVSINVHMPGFPMCLELEQSRSQVISLPQTLEVQGSVRSSNMIVITSQKPLSSILMNYKTRTADTTIVYPVTDWGNEYYVVTPNYGDLSKLFAIMNLENSNSVDVYLTGKVTFNQITYIKGSKLTIFLSKYESVQLMSMDDLSGTKIVSTKPVGVIAGHVCSNLNVRCNVLFEQLLPVTRWGSSFIVPPQPYQRKDDYVYVAASQSTDVLIQYGDKKDSKQLKSGEVISLKIDGTTPLYITASRSIQVMFYSTGGSRGEWGFDTFLMNVVPTNLFCSKYFIQGYDKFENRLLVVAKPSDISEIRFDNQLLLKTVTWAPVKGTEYSWAHIEYGQEEKPHYIEHPKSSFGVYSIGTVLYNGYGSPAPCAIDSVPIDSCENKQCRTGEKCQPVNGQATCVPVSKAECIAWGDPHYRTFDGRSFDFQGTCTYTIAKTCGNETLPSFNIEAKNENRGSTQVAYLKHVNVQVYGLTITMAKSENGRVRVNQNMYYLPSTLQEGKVKIYQSGGHAVLDTDFGLRLSYDWNHHLTVSITSTFLGQLCGLCGNYNGDSKDDFVMVDGKEANNAASFGTSWKVKDDDPACWDDCKGECKTCESNLISKYQGQESCGLLAKVDGPFRDCHAVIKPELFMDGCVYDVCLNDGFRVFLCQALKTYADACQARGVEVYNWRKQSQCPLTCPPNSHYESCGSACPASCSNPSASVNCKLPCTETCQCNEGFVLSAGECVPVKKCGCTYQGRYYPPGVRLWSDNSCEQSCICDAGTGKVQCRNTKCKPFEVCKVVKGVRDCYSNRKATCSASGDPHYISFDGRKFDFQGTCFYQLAAVCNSTDELEKFQVQVQNEHRGNKAVAYTRLVQVNVYGHIIIISTDHAGKVQVDNLWENLPLSIEDNRLSIQSKGWKAIIQTGFGLEVTFDWNSRVTVTVPESYAGAMCGLCGNYNQDGKDDLTMKNGQLTQVPAEFGASWKTENIPGCSDQCKGTCPNCDVTQKRQYETNAYCGIMTDPTGPFRDCHAKVPPTYFFDDCVFDACLYKGMQTVVCKAISGYVTKCQEAGAQVYAWRKDTFCAPVCPQNSHYELCASGCPSTCASLTTGTQCDALCEEGCQCNEGFILSGVQCVPIAQCGCMYSGRYYKAGEMFFPDGLCTSQCTCGASGAVQCQPITCGENEACQVKNGVQGCHPLGEGKCTASGDPHYTSFDGLKFDFQGTCTYTLAKLLYTNGSLTPFEVQVENESYGKTKVAVTRMVVTKVNGYSITMEQKVQWRVKVNGINTNLPLKLDDGKVSVIQQGKNIILQTEFGLKVLYDLVYYVQVTVPGNYRNKVGGLCGNFNGNKKDEFALQGGGLTENVNAFGASWQVFVEGAKCNHGCDQDCPRCDETNKTKYSKADSCGIISSTTGPFAACRSVISPDIYFENCVFDVCVTDGLRDILCRNLEAYTAACQDAGVIIKPWRNDGFCSMTCPKNSQYEVCADTCGSACASIIAPLTCTSQCYEGCQCDPGFVFDGEQCVSSGNCGCSHNGRYMKVGESLMSADCSRKCTCNPKGAVSCETIQCTTGCAVHNGAQICLDELVDLCKKKQCRNGETCQQVDNQAVCLPLSKAECIAWGDPHYRTFDGRSFDFQGTCTYTIAKTCGNETLPSFNIEAKNENRGSTQVAYLKHVNVQVYGLTITMAKSENGRVRVNQNMYYLPSTLQEGKVKIYQSGGHAVLDTDFGLRLSYDWNHHLTVSITSTFLGQLCGLCGNYNGDSKDDFVMVDGKEANNAASFGTSWKVKDDDPACWDDCKGECKTCESNLISKYQGQESCGLLAKVDGPFRDCHAVIKPELFMDGCVYDVCLNDGFRVFLCQALKTYADACQARGVEVYNWRKQSQCPLTCPPNSHYESCGSACPASCSNPSASVNCKLPCTETCQCNEGFVLSAGECVPVKKCGCTYQGRYYPPGVRLWSDNSCEQSCICDAGTGKVQCRNTKCKPFEVCKVVKGVRDCYSNRKATCSASGDPHYISFDGRKFDFQGTCFYQLAAVCNSTDELEKFQVQVQNEHRGNKAVAYTRLVQVNVYGHIIIISTDHAGKVQVDNLWENLPLSIEDNRLSIQSKGWKAIIQTGFGLEVTFDWNSRVTVTVPESYAGAMCGLCGNYNQDGKDDLTMKNGQLTQVPAEFGASWKTENIPGCSDQCKGTCPNCDVTQKRQYETNAYCGIMTDPTGPFRDCHAKVPPTYFFDDCVFDACLYKGMQTVVCKAISGYVTKCQEAGAQVYAWRKDTFCAPVCPQNSHYELCASGCPSTCASLTTGTQCDALCEEGCQCNEGFILSGVQCVPIAQCGCMYSGRYYKAGEMFFPDGLCTSQCTCGASGAVQCQPITCGENEACQVKNGVQGCHPLGEGKCTASGDPHYTSFDGLKFDFQGTCTYTLAKLLYTNGSLTPFEVQVENESYGKTKVAVTRMVVTKVNGYSITMEQKVQWRVKVNGINTNLPLKLDDGKVSVIQQGKNIILQTEFGLKVLYDLVYYVQVTVPGNYRNKVGGLCGNFNGNKKDEFALQGGGLTENVNAFGASWQVFVEGAKCNHGCDQDCPRCDETNKTKYSKADSCGIISSTTGPFAACRSVISPDIYFENCVFDVCVTDGLRDILCRNLEAYTAACQDAGVIIKPWRNDGFCPMTCPKNSQYEVCADTCGSACASIIAPLTCTSQCYEGCQCDPGFVFDGEQCVSSGNCGCSHNGRYMKVGESLMSADCSRKCTCNPKGAVSCETIQCTTGCAVHNGAQICLDELVDLCKKKQCRNGETCQQVDNQAVCLPLSKAECIAWGDPHYRTFDGRSFDFQGTCTYTIAKTCGNETLPSFNIEAKNENRGSTQVAYLKHVNVQVYGLTITMAKSENGRVRVNQNMYYLPSTLQEGKVKIYQSGGHAVLDTDFGLRLSYDWNHHLTVSITSTFLGQLCGLCGNYNGDSKDDFVMVDGKEANNAASFGTSWKVKDDDPACWDDCKGECKTCESNLISKYQGQESCGLLAKVDGPFRDCHAVIKPELFMDGCVYDVCLNDGFRVFLCQALKTYADACQARGVEVYNWRKQSQCPLTCPPNSHYESCGSACPASCSNPSASVNCKLPCTETCQCNEGFVLSAGECVPVKKCGCTYQGRYYPPGVRLWSDNSCEQSCICDAGTGKVQCRNTKCKPFEVCKVVKGVRDCYSNRKATCSASGDPHYISFDGRKFDFQGTCFYQLAAVCNSTDELEKFQVQVQNEHRGNKAVAYTRLVQVNVYGHIIIISTDHAGKVQVDNLWENLPLSIEDNRLSIQSKGWKAIIQTGFGLEVTFDWNSRVTVTVPESYAGAMCGLCGNYNQDGKDDLTMKNGQLTQVPAEFGASWKTENIPGCSDQCKGTCPNCDVTQKRQYETNAYCGIMTDPTGPFRDCHAKVPPTYFFDDCVFDACLYKGMQTVVCKAISGYVTKCQEAGAQVYAWRKDTFCAPVCPQNSHYELCASGCPSTCASLTTGTQCDALCEEGCQCNEGFILSGVQCVPIAQCGCMYSGRYYKAGEMFFPDGLCTSQCTCGASGAVQCQPITCGENEACQVKNGVQGCHPLGEGKCTASGDPHYTSFDGLKFDFQGTCTYTLAKLLYTNGSLTPFEVQVENESYGKTKVAVTRMVVTKVNGYSITMEQKVQWRVKVNGINTNLPLKLDDGKVSVIQQGKNIILQTEFGLKVLYDLVYYVQVTVPGNYRNKVGGLCGNFNGNKKDEFALQGGGLTENVNAFGASWQVFVEGAKCNHGCDQDCPRCDETNKAKYSKADSCGIISSTTGPFAACRSIISPDIYFENCVFDVCATDGLRDILCRNLEAYTAACQDAGVIIKPWRNDGFCPMTCPVNSQYDVCADTCGSTCASAITTLTCSSKCYEGCQCESGYVSDGEKCVLLNKCGCVHNGRYMKVGESLVSEDCTERCKCTVEGYVSCGKISCAPGESCVVQRGIRTCGRTHASCNLLSMGGLTTFDKLMTTLGSSGKYKMITLCDSSQTRFKVTADLNLAAPTPMTKAIYFNYEATSIVLKPDLVVLVNGQQVMLPADIGDISIRLSQGTVLIKHSSGIELKYCSLGNVKVTVSEAYASRLCGLCGNFNGLIPDDLMMRSSRIATNILAFHTDWKE